MSDSDSSSIYIEATWVLLLFAATALLREAVGELSMQTIAKGILRCTHVRGRTIDTVISCSNGGRSLGFGAIWRLWNTEPTVVHRYLIALPFLCWAVGMPVKLVAVSAVRGGNAVLGEQLTWAVGIGWIVICVAVKIAAFVVDRRYGVVIDSEPTHRFVSYRRVFQNRFCQIESLGVMLPDAPPLSSTVLIERPLSDELGVDIEWDVVEPVARRMHALTIRLTRHGLTDKSPNGLRL
jgi:hypothetical protein